MTFLRIIFDHQSIIRFKFSFVYNLSAGHDLHEYTTGSAFPEIEKFFFDDNYLEAKIIEHNEKTKK